MLRTTVFLFNLVSSSFICSVFLSFGGILRLVCLQVLQEEKAEGQKEERRKSRTSECVSYTFN